MVSVRAIDKLFAERGHQLQKLKMSGAGITDRSFTSINECCPLRSLEIDPCDSLTDNFLQSISVRIVSGLCTVCYIVSFIQTHAMNLRE
jgi:hypothetical protein